jgi:UDP-glucose 6-dehydrogenase
MNITANPEFLREGTAIRDFEEPPSIGLFRICLDYWFGHLGI